MKNEKYPGYYELELNQYNEILKTLAEMKRRAEKAEAALGSADDEVYDLVSDKRNVECEVLRLRAALEKAVSELERADGYGVPGLHRIIYESHELLDGK